MVGEITAEGLKARLDAGDTPVVLDVREPWEVAIARLECAVVIPMDQIPARLGELDAARDTIVMCYSGGRSMQVAQFLAARGFASVSNLVGGILAWTRDVDPTLDTY